MTYDIRYCINCEELVAVEDGLDGHTILVGDTLPFDVEFCTGPFATSSPPENFDPNWEMVDEPGQEELAHMNLYAEEFLNSL